MILDLVRTFPVAVLVGVMPGYFWSACLSGSTDRVERLVFSTALSMTLVPAVALGLINLAGGGVTLSIAIVSPLLVLGSGALVCRFTERARIPVPVKETARAPAVIPPPPLALTLVPVILAFLLVLGPYFVSLHQFWRELWLEGACQGWPSRNCNHSGSVQRFIIAVVLLLFIAGMIQWLGYRRGVRRADKAQDESATLALLADRGAAVAKLLLFAVLILVLIRGYFGVVLHDWPFIRGLDQYSHAIMAHLMMTQGVIRPYLIYPPGFHTLLAIISRLSGLDPLDIFPVLGPAALLLPTLSLYVLGQRLWGPYCGVAAAFFLGITNGGIYYYFNDGMYPNLIAAQFFMVLSLAALIRLYHSACLRSALLFALLGSGVFLYHQVSSLYMALILALVSMICLPCLLLRDRRTGLTLLGSLALLACLSLLYIWKTYHLTQIIAGVLHVSHKHSGTANAIAMAIGSQRAYHLDTLTVSIVSQPVAWGGLLGVIFVIVDRKGWCGLPHVMTRITLLVWVLIMVLGASTSYSGFPQRFGRDLGVPLSLFAGLALVLVMQALRHRRKSFTTAFAASLATGVLLGIVTGIRAAVTLNQAISASPHLTTTSRIAAAGKWLQEHKKNGTIMISPEGNQVPSRMMLAMSNYSAFQSFTRARIKVDRDLPPGGPGVLREVLWVISHPASQRAANIIQKRRVDYVVLYKHMPDRKIEKPYWKDFKAHPGLYQIVFENKDVLIAQEKSRQRHNRSL